MQRNVTITEKISFILKIFGIKCQYSRNIGFTFKILKRQNFSSNIGALLNFFAVWFYGHISFYYDNIGHNVSNTGYYIVDTNSFVLLLGNKYVF